MALVRVTAVKVRCDDVQDLWTMADEFNKASLLPDGSRCVQTPSHDRSSSVVGTKGRMGGYSFASQVGIVWLSINDICTHIGAQYQRPLHRAFSKRYWAIKSPSNSATYVLMRYMRGFSTGLAYAERKQNLRLCSCNMETLTNSQSWRLRTEQEVRECVRSFLRVLA